MKGKTAPTAYASLWDHVPLQAITTKIGSGATPTGGSDAYQQNRTGFALIRSQNVFDRRFDEEGLAFISDEQAHRLRGVWLSPGDILLNITGDGVTFGRACVVPESVLPACVNQHVSIIRAASDVAHPGYLLSFLTHPNVKPYIESFNAGGSRRAITKGHIEAFKVPCPPLPEQRAIARILGALDDKIELNRRTNETLEAMARALFQSWFVDFDPVRAKMEGRQPEGMDAETAKLFPGKFEDSQLGPIPAGWSNTRVGSLLELQRGTTYKSAHIGEPGPVLLGLASIRRDGGFRRDSLRTYGGESPEKLILRPGELFASLKDVTQSGDLLGSVARVPPTVPLGRLTQDTVKLIVPEVDGLSEFVYWSLRSPEFRTHSRAHAMGTTNLSISREDFLAFPVALPPRPDLKPLLSLVSALSRRFEDESAMISLTALRDALLPKLLSGELRVPEAERLASEVL